MIMMQHSVNDNTHMGLVILFFKFKSFDQFNPPPPRTTLNYRHLLSCGSIESSLFAVSTGTAGEMINIDK